MEKSQDKNARYFLYALFFCIVVAAAGIASYVAGYANGKHIALMENAKR